MNITDKIDKTRNMIGRFPISVIVLTLNEEINISACLESLSWIDDVIIVDSFSRDRTVEISKRMRSDIRVLNHEFKDFGDQRNWAIDNTNPKHEWILFLDADERCTPELAEGIRKSTSDSGDTVGFYLTYRNIFLGKWIKHCTFYPSWQLRLFKKGYVRFRKEGHGQREVTDGPLDYITAPYDHYGFSHGIFHWIERHNKYSTMEVKLIQRLVEEPLRLSDFFKKDIIKRRRCLKRLAARVGFRPVFRFIYTYFIKKGFLDGKEGFIFCLLRVAHEIHITAKLKEAKFIKEHGIVDVV